MGDEADADWQEGLVEAGIEDTKRWKRDQRIQTRNEVPFRKQRKRYSVPIPVTMADK